VAPVKDCLPAGRHGAKVPDVLRFHRSEWLVGALVLLTSGQALGSAYATAQIQRNSVGGTDCASADSLIAAVEQQLQRRVFVTTPDATLRISVEFGQTAGEWFADVELFASQGQHLVHRRISSRARECSGLEEPLALVIALMVDLTQDDVKARSVAAPPADATVVRVPAYAKALVERTAVLSLSEISILGQLPELGWGTRLATEWRLKAAWSLELGLTAFLPVTVDDGAACRARFALYTAEIGLCALVTRGTASELRICGGPQFGLERARGVGYAWNRSAQTALVQPFVKAESTWWPVPRFGVRLALGATTPIVRDKFYATRADGAQAPLFRPAIVAPFLLAGLCLEL
jgi:hypothetical protein